jgi:hypothetical protein
VPQYEPGDGGSGDDIRRRAASRVAWSAGVVFLLIMAAGADWPPPPGFAFVVLLAAGIVAGLRRLLPRLLADWEARGARYALVRTGLMGFGAGAIVWAIASALPLDRPDGVPVAARLIGFVVVSVAAAGAALTVMVAARWLVLRAIRRLDGEVGPDPNPAA